MIDINEIKATRLPRLEKYIYDMLDDVYFGNINNNIAYYMIDDDCCCFSINMNTLEISPIRLSLFQRYEPDSKNLDVDNLWQTASRIFKEFHENYKQ